MDCKDSCRIGTILKIHKMFQWDLGNPLSEKRCPTEIETSQWRIQNRILCSKRFAGYLLAIWKGFLRWNIGRLLYEGVLPTWLAKTFQLTFLYDCMAKRNTALRKPKHRVS